MEGVVLISPTEPAELKAIGTVSSVPESYGADIWWPSAIGTVGVQRKEVHDLVNSARSPDARFGKELSKMDRLDVGVLIVEGDMGWTRDGMSLAVSGWSEKEHHGLIFSVQSLGVWSLTSHSLSGTIELVSRLHQWSQKKDHSRLLRRTNPKSQWGRADNRDWGCHLLSGFEGVSLTLAGRIYDRFGGVPLQWTVDELDLMDVAGIGAKKAIMLVESLGKGVDSGVDGGTVEGAEVQEL